MPSNEVKQTGAEAVKHIFSVRNASFGLFCGVSMAVCVTRIIFFN